MKINSTTNTETIIFDGLLLIDFIYDNKNEDRKSDGKYSIIPNPQIRCSFPRQIEDFSDEYEIIIFNTLFRNNKYDTDQDNIIIETQKNFCYMTDSSSDKKEFFEYILSIASQDFCREFESQFKQIKSIALEKDINVFYDLQEIEFLFIKLGSKYRPFPIIDYNNLFKDQ